MKFPNSQEAADYSRSYHQGQYDGGDVLQPVIKCCLQLEVPALAENKKLSMHSADIIQIYDVMFVCLRCVKLAHIIFLSKLQVFLQTIW